MLIPTQSITDWRDLQEKTCQLFSEMDYHAEVSKKVSLAGRGEKEIDVFVTDPCASYNKIYLIECKHWESRIPQEVVHAFKTVMEETGANTGFIVSKVGFQSGAFEAARFTNIKLLTFDELQHLYGNEWFRKQKEKLELQVQRLCTIAHLHFDQWTTVGFQNNMYFRSNEQRNRLAHFHRWVQSLILSSRGRWPESYAGPEPVHACNDPTDPDIPVEEWFEFPTVRDYFRETTKSAKDCADAFELFETECRKIFDSLPDSEQDAAHFHVIFAITEELPIRVLKRRLPAAEYERLIQLIDKTNGGATLV